MESKIFSIWNETKHKLLIAKRYKIYHFNINKNNMQQENR